MRNVFRNLGVVFNDLTLIIIWNTPRIPFDHLRDELELVLRLLDQLLDLPAGQALLDRLPIVLLLADLQAVAGEALDRLAVPLALRDRLDLFQGLGVERDEDLAGVGDDVEADDAGGFLHAGEQGAGAGGEDAAEKHGGGLVWRLDGSRDLTGVGGASKGSNGGGKKVVSRDQANDPSILRTSCIVNKLERVQTLKPDSSNRILNDTIISTAERVKSFKVDEDPSLVELLFHYGRYLLISCSRPGTQAANLQGIWSKDIEPAWDAAPHLNINLQMNYWPALSCNLSECQEPLFDYIASLAVNGTKTAKVNYEASGWVAHQVSDIWAKTSPDRGNPVWAMWPMGGAWLCTHLWEHYTFSMDKDFLENKAYPLLERCASFLLAWLIEGRGGYLETNPSTSPEHSFITPDGKTASVSYSSTMDIAIIKEVFSAFISSAEVLGRVETDLVKQIKKAVPKLPPMRVLRDGTIMEWAQDFKDPEVNHRHISHLFGLFPGHSITIEKTPDLCKAAGNSLYKRGDVGPGWSTTWKMACWARLREEGHAYRLIKQLIDLVDPDHESDFEGGVYSNLFTAHPPFQIDANFGFTAAIAEMLVQSTERDLYLLPALPRDKWGEGSVKGLKARGNVTVNISWKGGELHEAHFWSKNQNLLRRLHYKGTVATMKLCCGSIYTFNHNLKCVKTQPL